MSDPSQAKAFAHVASEPTVGPPSAMLLAAGFGSRLGALGRARPKPLLPVLGWSLLEWGVRWLAHHGIRTVTINVHHLAPQVEAVLERLADELPGLDLAISHEHGQILGTGGGLRHARPLLERAGPGPIVVANAKLLVDLDLGALLAAHRDHRRRWGAQATLVLRPDRERAWGQPLGADSEGRLAELLGERRGKVVSGPCMFTGIHVVEPALLDRIPPDGEQCVIRAAYRPAFRERRVAAWVQEFGWWEHSTPERYALGVFRALDGAGHLPWGPSPWRGRRGALDEPSALVAAPPIDVSPGVRLGPEVRLGPYVQLGAGVQVAAGVSLARVIAMPGATIERSLSDAIVTSEGDVVPLTLPALRRPGQVPPPGVARAIAEAYANARYEVELAGARLTLSVGRIEPALDAALAALDGERWALVTPCNPFGVVQPAPANERALAELVAELRRQGLRSWPARNLDPTGAWPVEPGRFVLDLSEHGAAALAASYGQLAWLSGRAGQAPALRWTGLRPGDAPPPE